MIRCGVDPVVVSTTSITETLSAIAAIESYPSAVALLEEAKQLIADLAAESCSPGGAAIDAAAFFAKLEAL